MKNTSYKYFRIIALAGNVLYILWMFYNGIDEGFKAKPIEALSLIGLMLLLGLNFVLLGKNS